MNWTEALSSYSNELLAALCTANRIAQFSKPITQSNRADAIRALQKTLVKTAVVKYALKFMGPVEKTIIKSLMISGGTNDLESVRRQVQIEGAAMKPVRLADVSNWQEARPDYQGTPHFEDAVARTVCFGLVFTHNPIVGHQISFTPGRMLFIPEATLALLDEHPDFQGKSEPPMTQQPPMTLRVSAADFQRDLSRYWRHGHKQSEIALTTQGWIYKANFKTFLAALNLPTTAQNDESSNARLHFMRRLLVALHEFEGDNFADFLYATQDSKLLGLPMAQRIKDTFDTWQHSGAWNELNRIPTDHHGVDHRREAPPILASARTVVLRTIARLGSGHPQDWIGTDALIGQIRRKEYQFLIKRPERRYYYDNVYSNSELSHGFSFLGIRDESVGWTLVEQAYIVNMLTGPLYWIGLVELGYNKDVQTGENIAPLAFRLTDVGQWLLGLAEAPQFAETGGRLVVQPNFVVLAMEPIDDRVLIDLDRFADSTGGERVINYELTRASVYRGQRQGWHVERILQFLEQHQGIPVAANVRRSLEEWESQHQRITFRRNQLVVQFADTDTQAETRDALYSFQVRSLNAQFEVIEGQPAAQVIKALHDAGWIPLVERESPSASATALNKVIVCAEDGRVTLTQPSLNVTELGQLSQFAQQSDNDEWRITPESIRRAVAKGLTVDQILPLISELQGREVPLVLEKNIRKWSGFYGQASLQSAVLLELGTVDVLTTLMADADIGLYLAPIEGSSKPLAIVAPEHANTVRTLLIERGVQIVKGNE